MVFDIFFLEILPELPGSLINLLGNSYGAIKYNEVFISDKKYSMPESTVAAAMCMLSY